MSGNSELYLKISYKSKETGISFVSIGELNQQLNIEEKKHRVCGGMYNRNFGTIILKINDIEEAVDVVRKASKAGSEAYKYEINYKLLAV